MDDEIDVHHFNECDETLCWQTPNANIHSLIQINATESHIEFLFPSILICNTTDEQVGAEGHTDCNRIPTK